MFERRLLMLLGLAVVVVGVLLARTAQLTFGENHRRLRKEAERFLLQTTYIPTIRGAILDRNGKELAIDQSGYDIAVSYAVLSHEWAFDHASRAARKQHREIWAQLGTEEREAIVARFQKPYDEQVRQLMQLLVDLGAHQGMTTQELEKRRNAIIAEVQAMSANVTFRNQQRRIAQLNQPFSWADANTPVREETQKHSMLRDVNEQVRTIIAGFIADAERAEVQDPQQSEALAVWREVEVTRPKHRRYPHETYPYVIEIDRSTMPPSLRRDEPMTVTIEGLGMHVVGLMRDFYAADLETEGRHPFYTYNAQKQRVMNLAGYRDGDRLGSTGIEASMENRLRGTRGRSVRHRDTGFEERIEPQPGRDVHLTIDIDLQARLQALLSEQVGLTTVQPYQKSGAVVRGEFGTPLNGAAIILDIETSEVLAAVSNPSMSLRLIKEDPDQIYKNPWRQPFINRVVGSRKPPGSTIKPIMLVSAVTAGRHDLHSPINCTGILDPKHPNRFRCWIFKKYLGQHGPLGATDSLEVSCNIYYYTLGQRMGVKRTVEWYSKFGINKISECGLPEEIRGSLPDPATTEGNAAINMGIGQGPVAWTPLQAAAAYATLARGGIYISPTFIKDEDRLTPRSRIDLHLNRAAVDAAMEGMHKVVTGSQSVSRWLSRENHEEIFNVTGVTLYGKTGSADPVKRWVDLNNSGRRDEGDLILDEEHTDDHGWYIVLVQPDSAPRPTHVIVVVTEYGGSGSVSSGPIANQIIHMMQQGGWL